MPPEIYCNNPPGIISNSDQWTQASNTQPQPASYIPTDVTNNSPSNECSNTYSNVITFTIQEGSNVNISLRGRWSDGSYISTPWDLSLSPNIVSRGEGSRSNDIPFYLIRRGNQVTIGIKHGFTGILNIGGRDYDTSRLTQIPEISPAPNQITSPPQTQQARQSPPPAQPVQSNTRDDYINSQIDIFLIPQSSIYPNSRRVFTPEQKSNAIRELLRREDNISQIDKNRAVSELIRLINDRDTRSELRSVAAAALGTFGTGSLEAERTLISLLGHHDWLVQGEAANALGNIGNSREAFNALNGLLESRFEYVRNNAHTARTRILERIGAN